MNDNYYQDTAFNSSTAELQRPWDNTTFDIRLAGRRQPWLKDYSRQLPMKFVEDWLLNKASFIKVQHLMNHESFNFITTKGGWALLHTWMKIFFLLSSFFLYR
ncbi:hypothetical protein [Photobacterium sp.]|uniref:hypothetical protein n=1 Tax=Photobacterium sp. TaxID=660 RepID=UPI00299D42CD|nr:hypothetical protein [Photobacterium sp.]MDX1302288.1 hypothetical protein [Photobacterium sp.]